MADDPYRYPRDDRSHLPPRPPPETRYQDRDAHWETGYRGRDDYHRGREPDYHRGGHAGGRGRTWDDEERDVKRGRYDDERDRRPYYDDYPPARSRQDDYAPPPPSRGHYGGPYDGYDPAPRSYESPDPSPAPYAAPVGRKPPVRPEPPSASVVLLGLPPHVGDAQLRYFLEDMGASIDSTTVIMDRAAGVSKRYGFAKFSSVEHARAFVEPNFPSVPWKERGVPGPDDGMRIKINYSQKSGGWREDQGATARLTDDQRRATEGSAPQGFYVNDGTRDVGSTPTQILLLRGLDALTNEEEIVAALSRVGGRAGGEVMRGGVKRVMITRDRASRQSWGFAFVQFSDVKLATDVLAAAFNASMHPSGFRIRNRIIALSFTHENSFIPIYAKSDWSFRGEGGQQLAYWDDKGFVQPWLAPMPSREEAAKIPTGPRADEDAKMDKDMLAFLGELEQELPAEFLEESSDQDAASSGVAPPKVGATPATLPAPGSIAPISIKPIGQTSHPQPVVVAQPAAVAATSNDKLPAEILPVGGVAAAAPLGGKEKKSDLIISRKAAPNIAKWNVKQKELKVVPDAALAGTPSSKAATAATATKLGAEVPAPVAAASVTSTKPIQPQPIVATPASQPSLPTTTTTTFDDPEFVYGDPISMICLLCQRQFKKIEELRKHNKLSALHKTNLDKPEAVAACAVRKTAARKKHVTASPAGVPSGTDEASTTSDSAAPKYVDRAAARRSTFNQSGKPDPPVPSKKKKFDAPEPPPKPVPIEAPNKDGLEETNAGMKMLEKMGWSKGAGLGATGAGRVDPVQAAQFAQGAGLGSTKGIAVGSENPNKSYAEQIRDKARARLNES